MPVDYRPPEPIPLRPAAAPVDTFQGAPRPRIDNSLTDLAQSLSQFDAGLRDFMKARQDREAQEDILKGQAAFYQNNQQGFEDAVREGKIPAFASPTFVASYKKAQGNVAGFDLQAKFSAAYDAWPGKNSEDPKAFTEFAQQFMRDNLSDLQDPQVLRGVMPHVNSVLQSGLQQWVKDRHDTLYKGSITTAAAEITQSIQGAKQLSLRDGKPTDYSTVFKDIMATREEIIKRGIRPDDIDKALVDAAIDQALEQRDPNLLKFLDEKVPGKGDLTFGQMPWATDKKRQAMDHLETLGRRALADAKQEQQEADKRARAAVTGSVITMLATDPATPIPENLLALGTKYDPNFRVDMLRAQRTLAEGAASDPLQVLQVHIDIMDGKPGALQDAIRRGVFRSAVDLDKARALQQSVQEAGDKVPVILKNSAADIIRKAIASRTSSEANLALVIGGVIGLPDAGIDATAAFNRMLVDFIRANPNATLEQQTEYVNKAGKIILDSLTSQKIGGEAKFAPGPGVPVTPFAGGRPSQAPSETSTRGQPPGPQTEPVVPGAPTLAPAPTPQRSEGILPQRSESAPPVNQLDEAQRWAQGALSPTQRVLLERAAQDEGKSTDAKLLEVYRNFKAKGAGGPSTVPAEEPGTGAGGDVRTLAQSAVLDAIRRFKGSTHLARQGAVFATRALLNDPQAANLLDFISGPEAAGNYNAVIGNTRSTEDLSKLTIAEVFQLQSRLVARGMPSGAVGRYQFLNSTLRGLVAELGISTSAKFTPQLQDRMGLALLERRGYSAWKAGRLSDAQFAKNLSLEWAALPDPATGRSSHEGVGGNRAGVTVRQVFDTLRRFVSLSNNRENQ